MTRLGLVVVAALVAAPSSAGPSKSARKVDTVLVDDDCTTIGALVGAPSVGSKPDTKRITICYRKDKATLDCIMNLTEGDKFVDGKSTTPITLRTSTIVDPPRMLLAAAPESTDLVFLDWSKRRYVWSMTRLDTDAGYVLQRQCVGNVMTGNELEKALAQQPSKP